MKDGPFRVGDSLGTTLYLGPKTEGQQPVAWFPNRPRLTRMVRDFLNAMSHVVILDEVGPYSFPDDVFSEGDEVTVHDESGDTTYVLDVIDGGYATLRREDLKERAWYKRVVPLSRLAPAPRREQS